jgi:hypothetical protein
VISTDKRPLREEADRLVASGGLGGGVEAEGEGERVVAGAARVRPGAGRGEGEEVLEEVVLRAAGLLLARHGRRPARVGDTWQLRVARDKREAAATARKCGVAGRGGCVWRRL